MKRNIAILCGFFLSLSVAPVFATVSHVFVSNASDNTMSVIKCVMSSGKNKDSIRCEEKERVDVGFGTSWPANQYDGNAAWWWTGMNGFVRGLNTSATVKSLAEPGSIVDVDTYVLPGRPDSGANFIGIMPNGRTAWNSAREVDRIQEIDTDPGSPTFGTILTSIPVPDLDSDTGSTSTRGAARPCDATITPDGRWFLEPDLAGESVTVVDTQVKDIIWQLNSPPLDPSEKVLPFMSTTNGNIVVVENFEAPTGTYDIWDVSVLPNKPLYEKKLTSAEGLGVGPQTSEFTLDGKYAYLIMNGLTDDGTLPFGQQSRIDILDVDKSSSTYLDIVGHIALPTNCGAHTGDFSNDGRYFFINCQRIDKVAVVDSTTHQVVLDVAVGDGPRGIIVK